MIETSVMIEMNVVIFIAVIPIIIDIDTDKLAGPPTNNNPIGCFAIIAFSSTTPLYPCTF